MGVHSSPTFQSKSMPYSIDSFSYSTQIFLKPIGKKELPNNRLQNGAIRKFIVQGFGRFRVLKIICRIGIRYN